MTWSHRYPSTGLVPSSGEWSLRYAEIARGLAAALGPDWLIEHVGSTSVPGLVAKPVIDMAVMVPVGATVGAFSEAFTGAGWTAPRELGDHAASFLLVEGRRTAIAHLFTARQWPEAHIRLFAAWLRSNARDRDRYEALKLDLIRTGAWEDGSYTLGKGEFVLEIVNRARQAQGLPPHPGPL